MTICPAGISRREALALLGAASLACTARPSGDGDPNVERPVPSWPDGPAPEVVVAIDGSGTDYTWYADGTVLRSSSDTTMSGSEEHRRMPGLEVAHVGADEVARLRRLVVTPDFTAAAPHYLQGGVHDGLHLFLIAGTRRIHIGNSPPGLPDALAQLKDTYHAIYDVFAAEGFDAFRARAPHLLAVHSRVFKKQHFADLLTVWANGVLDYRVVMNNDPTPQDRDWPTPTIATRQVPVSELAVLQAALSAPGLATVPPYRPRDAGPPPETGTEHMLAHGGSEQRIRVQEGHPVPAALRPVLAATAALRDRFAAPADEA